MQLRLRLDNQKEIRCMRQGRTSRRQCWKYNITRVLMAEDLNGYFSFSVYLMLVHYQFHMLNFKRLNLTI